jgi:hypothetical protein
MAKGMTINIISQHFPASLIRVVVLLFQSGSFGENRTLGKPIILNCFFCMRLAALQYMHSWPGPRAACSSREHTNSVRLVDKDGDIGAFTGIESGVIHGNFEALAGHICQANEWQIGKFMQACSLSLAPQKPKFNPYAINTQI